MYLFAHFFTGVLIALGVFNLSNDRRVFPICIAGALLPDLLDKPLMLLIPGIFGSTRTIGHSLLLVSVLVLVALLLWYHSRSILGFAFAGSVLSHQILDAMWILPVTWFFPLHGTFRFIPVSGNIWHFLWLESASPSEWVFALASGILIMTGYVGIRDRRTTAPSFFRTDFLLYGFACLLGCMGLFLIALGLNAASGSFLAPSYEPDTTLMAGIVALVGAIVFIIRPCLPRPAV